MRRAPLIGACVPYLLGAMTAACPRALCGDTARRMAHTESFSCGPRQQNADFQRANSQGSPRRPHMDRRQQRNHYRQDAAGMGGRQHQLQVQASSDPSNSLRLPRLMNKLRVETGSGRPFVLVELRSGEIVRFEGPVALTDMRYNGHGSGPSGARPPRSVALRAGDTVLCRVGRLLHTGVVHGGRGCLPRQLQDLAAKCGGAYSTWLPMGLLDAPRRMRFADGSSRPLLELPRDSGRPMHHFRRIDGHIIGLLRSADPNRSHDYDATLLPGQELPLVDASTPTDLVWAGPSCRPDRTYLPVVFPDTAARLEQLQAIERFALCECRAEVARLGLGASIHVISATAEWYGRNVAFEYRANAVAAADEAATELGRNAATALGTLHGQTRFIDAVRDRLVWRLLGPTLLSPGTPPAGLQQQQEEEHTADRPTEEELRAIREAYRRAAPARDPKEPFTVRFSFLQDDCWAVESAARSLKTREAYGQMRALAREHGAAPTSESVAAYRHQSRDAATEVRQRAIEALFSRETPSFDVDPARRDNPATIAELVFLTRVALRSRFLDVRKRRGRAPSAAAATPSDGISESRDSATSPATTVPEATAGVAGLNAELVRGPVAWLYALSLLRKSGAVDGLTPSPTTNGNVQDAGERRRLGPDVAAAAPATAAICAVSGHWEEALRALALPMRPGVVASVTALGLARRWGATLAAALTITLQSPVAAAGGVHGRQAWHVLFGAAATRERDATAAPSVEVQAAAWVRLAQLWLPDAVPSQATAPAGLGVSNSPRHLSAGVSGASDAEADWFDCALALARGFAAGIEASFKVQPQLLTSNMRDRAAHVCPTAATAAEGRLAVLEAEHRHGAAVGPESTALVQTGSTRALMAAGDQANPAAVTAADVVPVNLDMGPQLLEFTSVAVDVISRTGITAAAAVMQWQQPGGLAAAAAMDARVQTALPPATRALYEEAQTYLQHHPEDATAPSMPAALAARLLDRIGHLRAVDALSMAEAQLLHHQLLVVTLPAAASIRLPIGVAPADLLLLRRLPPKYRHEDLIAAVLHEATAINGICCEALVVLAAAVLCAQQAKAPVSTTEVGPSGAKHLMEARKSSLTTFLSRGDDEDDLSHGSVPAPASPWNEQQQQMSHQEMEKSLATLRRALPALPRHFEVRHQRAMAPPALSEWLRAMCHVGLRSDGIRVVLDALKAHVSFLRRQSDAAAGALQGTTLRELLDATAAVGSYRNLSLQVRAELATALGAALATRDGAEVAKVKAAVAELAAVDAGLHLAEVARRGEFVPPAAAAITIGTRRDLLRDAAQVVHDQMRWLF